MFSFPMRRNPESAPATSDTDKDNNETVELVDSRESTLARDILDAALGEVATKQDNGEDVVAGETFSVPITEEIAHPGEVTDLGASALRSAMAMHRDSHDPFLIDVDRTPSGECAEFMFM